jgi:hypothetical protein
MRNHALDVVVVVLAMYEIKGSGKVRPYVYRGARGATNHRGDGN